MAPRQSHPVNPSRRRSKTGRQRSHQSTTNKANRRGTNKPRLHPPKQPYEIFSTFKSELVIAIVGALGVDTAKVRQMISSHLESFGYKCFEVRLTQSVIPALAGTVELDSLSEFDRASTLINMGNQVREECKNSGVLAIAAAAEIARIRPDPDGPIDKVAYIVSSLKRPEEVAELRKIYSHGFYLFAVHCDHESRVKQLMSRGQRKMQRWEAESLISRDEHEPGDYGQDTRGTFHLADFFLSDDANDVKLNNSINRCIDLIFGHPHITPTFDEFAMFMAFASSVRSGDLSRQVGAVIARSDEILSTGANDCPRAGGGLYWPTMVGNKVEDFPLGRDYTRGFDSNIAERNELIQSILSKLPRGGSKASESTLRKSDIRNITEYGRVVHAEMEAILACARVGNSCLNGTIYCTTFPCHNCAKHIIASGIRRVVFIEPYPKSKALKFHNDSATSHSANTESKVIFEPFIGIGPRHFFDLFSVAMGAGRPVCRKNDTTGEAVAWNPTAASPRIQMLPFAHRRFEEAATEYLRNLLGGTTNAT